MLIVRLPGLRHLRAKFMSGDQLPGNQIGIVFVFVLDCLDSQERQAEQYSENQEKNLQLSLADLRAINRHGHCQAAANQDDCVHRAKGKVKVIAGGGKGFPVLPTIERVSKKHPAEEHDLGNQEHPHAKRAGVALLLHVLEMVLEPWVVYFVFSCCSQNSSPENSCCNASC